MARGRGFRRGSFGKRRTTDWEKFIDPSRVSVGSGNASSVQFLSLSSGGLHKPTIVRIRGRFEVRHSTLGTAGVQAWGAGLMLLTDAEAAASAIPGPITDIDEDRWIWLAHGVVESVGLAEGGAPTSLNAGRELIDIDSKAMRIWEENFQLTFVLENFPIAGTASAITGLVIQRVLLKLA